MTRTHIASGHKLVRTPVCAFRARRRLVVVVLSTFVVAALIPGTASAQVPTPVRAPGDTTIAILPARNPLPSEAASAGVTRFSFIVYGDTRGRRDGTEVQYEHSLIVDAMLRTIATLDKGPDPVKFVLQSGDAVVNGRDPKQWNTSFVSLINRITRDGGVPYFLAPGNHDVTGAADLENPGRKEGLTNYLRAMAQLIPPNGATRRLNGYPVFAFGYGNTFVLGIDSNIAEDSVQFAWAKAQLDGLDRKRFTNIVAFFHHPAFSSGPHGGTTVERATVAVRARYMPLFRQHNVKLIVTGHEHLFEHWVERYKDAKGVSHRIDQLVSGGGGAPIYNYQGEPDLRTYLMAGASENVRLEHLVRPGMNRGDNPYHYIVVHVDGERMSLDIESVDWGVGFAPYRSAKAVLSDTMK